MTLGAWRQRYERLGLCVLPLYSGSKQPVCSDWTGTPPPVQWREAGTKAGNIGLRTGNGFAVADADAPSTVKALAAYWAGLGIVLPTVATPSDGRHFYLLIADVPNDVAYSRWHPDVGPGELRVGPGAQVVAPCSYVNGKYYKFTPGSKPEDLLRMRPLRWRDLLPLVRPQQVKPLDALPIPFPHRELASWAIWLLGVVADMPPEGRVARLQASLQGVPRKNADGKTFVTWYASRSEAEQAIVLHAVWCGWDFAELIALFEEYQPGHYTARRDKEGYLHTCWQNALGWIAHTPERSTIAQLWQWAESRPWPGRGGSNEFLAYRALLQRAWLANTLQPDVSRRDVELSGSMGNMGARGALQRLKLQGLIAPVGQRQRPTAARTWQLLNVVDAQPVTIATPARGIDALPGSVELWAVLGHAAGMVYIRLNGEPQAIASLAAVTGKHRNTVRQALRTLAAYGLAVDMGSGWVVGKRNAAEVAHEVGAIALKNRRVATVERERDTFRRKIAEQHA
ncbi:MAG: bifunctional DNA primase/polymerase [Chloroflexi bacterium]|nr:bifunctional DNA primase/polymerase [Chloroflexota bacterium]